MPDNDDIDVTRRLRMGEIDEDVRDLARGIFFGVMEEMLETPCSVNRETIRRVAKDAIAAGCIFWDEWDVASDEPDIEEEPESEPPPAPEPTKVYPKVTFATGWGRRKS